MNSDTNIYSNVILEVKKHYNRGTFSPIKVECFHFLINVLNHEDKKLNLKLLKGNLLGIIHDEIYDNIATPR
jgi:hypothetical protein